MANLDAGRTPVDLYEIALPVGSFDRPCGCNQDTGQGESCVLIAPIPGQPGAVALRDSKHNRAGELRFTAEEWAAFLATQGTTA